MTIKDQITEQAIEMFMKSGIRAITMDDIAGRVGVSKRTLYENFRDKDDLIRNCLEQLDNKFNRQYKELLENSENTIYLSFNIIILGIKALNEINPLFFEELKKYHYRVWSEVHRVNLKKQKAMLVTILKKGINQKVFRPNISIDVVVTLMMEQLRLIHEKSLFPESKFPRQIVFENVFINFFRGIATQKGLDLIEGFLEKESAHFITVR